MSGWLRLAAAVVKDFVKPEVEAKSMAAPKIAPGVLAIGTLY